MLSSRYFKSQRCRLSFITGKKNSNNYNIIGTLTLVETLITVYLGYATSAEIVDVAGTDLIFLFFL